MADDRNLTPEQVSEGLRRSGHYYQELERWFSAIKKEHTSEPSNPLIARMFFLVGLVEEVGTGTNKIISWCKEWGLPEPEFEYIGNGVVLRFRKDIYTEEYLRNIGLNERQIKAVMYVKEKKRITNRDYQKLNACSRNTATNELRELVQKEIIKESGKKGAGASYVIAHLLHRSYKEQLWLAR